MSERDHNIQPLCPTCADLGEVLIRSDGTITHSKWDAVLLVPCPEGCESDQYQPSGSEVKENDHGA